MPGKVKNILLTTEVRPAGRRCRCAHDKRHHILKGETRVVVKNPGAPGEKGYCASCGRAMVTAAQDQLASLEAALRVAPTAPTTNTQQETATGPETHDYDPL